MLKILSRTALRKVRRSPLLAVSGAVGKLRVELAASLARGYSPFPQNLTFFLTYRCNLRCRVCGQWGDEGYVKRLPPTALRDEAGIGVLKRAIDEVAPYRPTITLCGGEVVLYPDWLEFVRHVKSRGLACILTTNGTLLEGSADALVEVGLDKLSLSIDGPEVVHNRARGGGGTFQAAMRAIHAVNASKAARNRGTPVVELGCTISGHNCGHLRELVDIAEGLQAKALIFLHLIYVTDEELDRQSAVFRELFETESTQWAGYRARPEGIDPEALIAELAAASSAARRVAVIVHPDLTPDEIRRYYTTSFFRPTSYGDTCRSPWTSAYVLPNGDVSPCSSFVAGNLKDGTFRSIWNNARFRHFRRELERVRAFPVCTRCCEYYKH